MAIRNRLSSADWGKILAEQAESGLSASCFCRERGIKPTSYFSAKKRLRLAQARPTAAGLSSGKAPLSAVLRMGTAANVSQRAAFVSVQVSDESGAAPQDVTAIRVQLRSGHQLWVGPGFDAAHLGRLVGVLESAS
jgi:hypothetical protein